MLHNCGSVHTELLHLIVLCKNNHQYDMDISYVIFFEIHSGI